MTPEILAAWTTSVATILLALFAFLAWRASTASLKIMRNQEQDSKDAVQRQVDDQNWGRQVESLANYTAALVELIAIPGLMQRNGSPTPEIGSPFVRYVSAKGTNDINNILSRIQATGLIWRMHHVRQTKLIWKLEALEEEVRLLGAAAIQGRVEWRIVPEATELLLEAAEMWQQELDLRETVAKNAASDRTHLSNARIDRDRVSEEAE